MIVIRIKTLSVSQLNLYIKRLIQADPILHMAQVAGEVSNCTYHSSGHVYFSLKDENSRVRCVMFRQQVQLLSFRMKDGMRVTVSGAVSLYERDGQYQIIAARVEETGLGDWFLAFQQLKEKLKKEGLMDESQKKTLPPFPENIGIITSESSAALQDFLTVLKRRWPIAKLYLFPAQVQGEQASSSLTEAMNKAATHPLDLILLGRGGGSVEELWAFNSESLAYAIARSPIPVVTGIGHETDFTIADFVADQRANTPTAAAELAVPDHVLLERQLNQLFIRLRRSTSERIERHRYQLNSLYRSTPLRSPRSFLEERQQALDMLQHRIITRMQTKLREQRMILQHKGEQLNQLSPLNVLGRGYAFVRDQSDNMIAAIQQVNTGDTVCVQLQDGHFQAQVTDVEKTGKKCAVEGGSN
ncbi:Exodeoxyribonuclease VII large subunit [Anoxynatronum buryatiense]|uniref:Exodeoxyribonuclease 7 large subunit n=1 Tax=Anoxynatronum buryatiense TaxID=489973 RepID=A0AA46AIB0_9CLOT|nr:Exodeoxyribonuclease VII large subunit [Anoxynatronum buryatiense]